MSWVRSRLRVGDDSGQATLESVGVLTIVCLVVAAVMLAVTANSPVIGDRTAWAICKLVTAG